MNLFERMRYELLNEDQDDEVINKLKTLLASQKGISFDIEIPSIHSKYYANKIIDENGFKILKKYCIKFARQFQNDIIINTSTNAQINYNITIGREGIDKFKHDLYPHKNVETRNDNADRPFAIMLLPILLKKAICIRTDQNRKPGKKPNIIQVDTFETYCTINNHSYKITIKTEEYKNEEGITHKGQNRFHFLFVKSFIVEEK